MGNLFIGYMVRHIEYLVKPYQDSRNLPVDGCARMEVPPFAHNPFAGVFEEISNQGITAEEYLNQMLELWKERVDYVDTNPDSLFVIIDIFREDSNRPDKLRALREYAQHKLGERFISLHDGYGTANYLKEKGHLDRTLKIHAYGEISDRCAKGETNELTRNLNYLRPDLQVTVDFDKKLCSDTLEGKFD